MSDDEVGVTVCAGLYSGLHKTLPVCTKDGIDAPSVDDLPRDCYHKCLERVKKRPLKKGLPQVLVDALVVLC